MKYFSDSITAIVLVCIGLGTNLYYFSNQNCGMSHTNLFALYAILLYSTSNFYNNYKKRNAIFIGLCSGLITVIRPSEIIVLLIPLLWNVSNFSDFKNRFLLIAKINNLFILSIFCFIIVALPQLIYWKMQTGSFLYYSYPNEGFDFTHPHIKKGLLGYQNGWLAYTPIMYFAIIGLFLMNKYFKKAMLSIYLFLPLHIIIIYSWHCWMYINGFGSRPMVETYPILAIPFACFLQYAWNKKGLKIISFLLLLFFIGLNLFQTWQFHNGLIWTEEGNWAFYKSILFKTKPTKESLIAFDCGEIQPNKSKIKFIKKVAQNNFEDSICQNYSNQIFKNGKYSFYVTNRTPIININASSNEIKSGDYIKISCWVFSTEMEYNKYQQSVLLAEFKHNTKSIRWRALRLQNKIANNSNSIWHQGKTYEWQYVEFFVKVPHRYKTENDELCVNVWNPNGKPVYIDDIEIEQWQSKN